MTETNKNGFRLFAEWLKETWQKGQGCANLWIYLFVGIIFCGGVGFWLLLLKESLTTKPPDLLMAFCSFSPAIAGASCMDFIFGENERKYLRGFSILFGALVLALTLSAFFLANYFCAIIATFLSLSLWWLANAENPKLTDVATPLASVGGNAYNEVKGNKGNIKI